MALQGGARAHSWALRCWEASEARWRVQPSWPCPTPPHHTTPHSHPLPQFKDDPGGLKLVHDRKGLLSMVRRAGC